MNISLYFLKELYHSDMLNEKKAARIKTAIAKGRGFRKAFFVCLSFFERDELDIIGVKELRRKHSHPGAYRIVGLGKDSGDAVDVAAIIVQDVFEKTGDARLKEYFREETLWQSS